MVTNMAVNSITMSGTDSIIDSSTNPSTNMATNLTSHSELSVKGDYVKVKKVGSGADGTVELWKHRNIANSTVVVKYPLDPSDTSNPKDDYRHPKYLEARKKSLVRELDAMKCLQVHKHSNIIELIGWDLDWKPNGPALFYEYCEGGDAHKYRHRLGKACKGTPIPEEILWKLFIDLTKALDFLATVLSYPLIHGDLKPPNILVTTSPEHVLKDVSILPLFKLADFSRVRQPLPGEVFTYNGTYEYAPPKEERGNLTPASDIWGMGATIQFFAYGMYPTMNGDDFIKGLKAAGLKAKKIPKPEDLDLSKWRKLIPVIYRPLNATVADQMEKWGVPSKHTIASPYSDDLNECYRRCLNQYPQTRISAQDLARFWLPMAESKIISARSDHLKAVEGDRIEKEEETQMGDLAGQLEFKEEAKQATAQKPGEEIPIEQKAQMPGEKNLIERKAQKPGEEIPIEQKLEEEKPKEYKLHAKEKFEKRIKEKKLKDQKLKEDRLKAEKLKDEKLRKEKLNGTLKDEKLKKKEPKKEMPKKGKPKEESEQVRADESRRMGFNLMKAFRDLSLRTRARPDDQMGTN